MSLAISEGIFSTWQYFEPTLEDFLCYWVNFLCYKWPNIEQIIWPSGHTKLISKFNNSAC